MEEDGFKDIPLFNRGELKIDFSRAVSEFERLTQKMRVKKSPRVSAGAFFELAFYLR